MSDHALPVPPAPPGRLVDARLTLLDRQVVDVEGYPVGVVDDLELTDPADALIPAGTEPSRVLNLVHGPIVLDRIAGGRHPDAHFQRIEWAAIAVVGSAIELAVSAEHVAIGWLEPWLARNVIARIPGGRHVPG